MKVATGLALLPVALTVMTIAPAMACGPMATVQFMESSPQDRFEIVNNSADDWTVAYLELMLDGSAGGLIFDTEGGGPGTSMYQPFGTGPSDIEALVPPTVGDGETALTLEFAGFDPGHRFVFTIDVDDTLPYSADGRQRVTDSEIDGALAKALFHAPDGQEMALEGHFGPDGIAIVSGLACS